MYEIRQSEKTRPRRLDLSSMTERVVSKSGEADGAIFPTKPPPRYGTSHPMKNEEEHTIQWRLLVMHAKRREKVLGKWILFMCLESKASLLCVTLRQTASPTPKDKIHRTVARYSVTVAKGGRY